MQRTIGLYMQFRYELFQFKLIIISRKLDVFK
jgi:hypothetical protein